MWESNKMLEPFLIHSCGLFSFTLLLLYKISLFHFLSMSILMSEQQQQQAVTPSFSYKTPDGIHFGRLKVRANCRISGGGHKVLRKWPGCRRRRSQMFLLVKQRTDFKRGRKDIFTTCWRKGFCQIKASYSCPRTRQGAGAWTASCVDICKVCRRTAPPTPREWRWGRWWCTSPNRLASTLSAQEETNQHTKTITNWVCVLFRFSFG